MEKYVLERDNDRAVSFEGELIAEVSSSPNNASPSYSRSPGRWAELSLYKTKSGKYVCHEVKCTKWQGEADRYRTDVFETLDMVTDFFGGGWLAKELYEKAGIEFIEEIS